MTEPTINPDGLKYPNEDELKSVFESIGKSLAQVRVGESEVYTQLKDTATDEIEIQTSGGPLRVNVANQPIFRLIQAIKSDTPVWSDLSSDFNLCYLTALAVSSEDPDIQILLPLYRALKEAVDDSGFNSVEIRSAMNGYRGRAEDLTADVIKRYQP